ncbi:MAG: M23 family metallopeptidase [Fibrobacterales bacterium]
MYQSLLFLLLIELFLASSLWSSSLYTPLGKPYPLSSSYLENRGSRYHAGFDFPTDDTVGIAIRAPENGFISRVKVSPFGYGKALYFQSDSLIYVFAHLDAFEGAIQKKVHHYQRSIESNDIDWRPKKGTLHLKKGALLAYSGSTGIGIPHLHFETRTSSPQTVSPTPFITVIDTIAPEITQAALIYADGLVQRFQKEGTTFRLPVQKDPQNISKLLLYITDFADGTKENPMSIAKLSLHCNDTLIYQKTYDSARYGSMSEIRHELIWSLEDSLSPQGDWHNLGAQTHHTTHLSRPPTHCTQPQDRLTAIAEDFLNNQTITHLTFDLPKEASGTPIVQSPWGNQDSTLFTFMGLPHLVTHTGTNITVQRGNKAAQKILTQRLISVPLLLTQDSTITTLTISSLDSKPRTIMVAPFKADKPYRAQTDNWTINMTSEIDGVMTMEFDAQSNKLIMHPKGLPIKKTLRVCLTGTHADSSYILQYLTETKREWSTFSRVTRKGPQLCTKINELRDIRMIRDTTPPAIKSHAVLPCKKYEQCHSKLVLSLEDDVSGFSSGNQIVATINGTWAPHYYDNEEETITIELPDTSESSKNTAVISLMDDAHNKREWKRTLTLFP